MRSPRTQVYRLSFLFCLVFTQATVSHAENCYDLTHPPLRPARDPIAFEFEEPFPPRAPLDVQETGILPDKEKGFFVSTHAIVEIPTQKIFDTISNPRFIKNSPIMEITTNSETREGFLRFLNLDITVRPLPFVSAKWKEVWAFNLTDGTPEAPSAILLTYQKTKGAEQLRHLCGSIWIRKLSPLYSDMSLYEEVSSPHRNSEDGLKGQLETLQSLRNIKSGEVP